MKTNLTGKKKRKSGWIKGLIEIMGDIVIHVPWEDNRQLSVNFRFHGRNAVRRVRMNAA